MKGEITLKILEIIGDIATNAADVMGAFLDSGYGASRGKIDFEISKRQAARAEKSVDREFQKRIRQDYCNLIYRLKKSGLIREEIENKKKFLFLTRKGKQEMSLLKEKSKNKLPDNFYQRDKGNRFIIVVFDVPEKEKRKREWLRSALKNMEFKIIQKSVWLGKNKIPQKFLLDLSKLNLIDFVEIFEITKGGSLKEVA